MALLIIHPGSVTTRAFLLASHSDVTSSRINWHLQDFSSKRSLLPVETLVSFFTQKYKGEFREKVVLRGNKNSFGRSLSRLSASGLVLAVEVGAAQSYLGLASFGRVEKVVQKNVGVGQGVEELFSQVAVERALNWFSTEDGVRGESSNYWGIKSFYSQVLPPNDFYQQAELVLAREALKLLGVGAASSVQVSARQRFTPQIILSGAVFLADAGASLHALLDGLNLNGVWNVWLDKRSVLHALGATEKGLLPKEELGLENLGTVMVLEHQQERGVNLGWVRLDLGLDTPQEIELVSGEIMRVPFSAETSGNMELELAPSAKISGDPQTKLVGGKLGVVIDARKRPIARAFNPHWKEVFR